MQFANETHDLFLTVSNRDEIFSNVASKLKRLIFSKRTPTFLFWIDRVASISHHHGPA
jgi:hypothetical protein